MKKASLIAATLVLSVGAGSNQVEAQALAGSDTLEEVTQAVLAAAPANGYSVSPLTYLGGGSGNGETALVNAGSAPTATNFQQIAPMSRRIKCSKFTGGANPNANGVVIGYDGIVLVRSAATFVNGDTSAYSTAASAGLPGGYVWTGGTDAALPLGPNYPVAADALRVLYFGRDHSNVTNCNSDLRQALVGSWNNLFEGTQSETCTALQFAYRRCDPSGTTDTFRSLLGIPGSTTFCNGDDNHDLDVIRRSCVAGDQVCGADGKLGVVQPICSEPFADSGDTYTSLPQNTATDFCTLGKFSYKPVVLPIPAGSKCPDGTAIKGGNCRVPYKGATAATGDFRCFARTLNRPAGAPATEDGRVYNLVAREQNGTLRKNARKAGQNTSVGHMGYRRIAGCTKQDATAQIGCMVTSDGCSAGFAGLQVLSEPNTRAIKLASKQSTDTTPEATAAITPEDNAQVILGANDPTQGYILGRKLYVNTLVGVSNLSTDAATFGPQQNALISAFQDRAVVDSIITSKNFIPVPGTGPLPLEAQSAALCAP